MKTPTNSTQIYPNKSKLIPTKYSHFYNPKQGFKALLHVFRIYYTLADAQHHLSQQSIEN